MKLEVAPASAPISFFDAFLYCLTLNHNGHKDWRMPTNKERLDLSISSSNTEMLGTWDCNDLKQVINEHPRQFCTPVFPVRDYDRTWTNNTQ